MDALRSKQPPLLRSSIVSVFTPSLFPPSETRAKIHLPAHINHRRSTPPAPASSAAPRTSPPTTPASTPYSEVRASSASSNASPLNPCSSSKKRSTPRALRQRRLRAPHRLNGLHAHPKNQTPYHSPRRRCRNHAKWRPRNRQR